MSQLVRRQVKPLISSDQVRFYPQFPEIQLKEIIAVGVMNKFSHPLASLCSSATLQGEARLRVLSLYKAWRRHIPIMCKDFDLPRTEAQCNAALRWEIRKVGSWDSVPRYTNTHSLPVLARKYLCVLPGRNSWKMHASGMFVLWTCSSSRYHQLIIGCKINLQKFYHIWPTFRVRGSKTCRRWWTIGNRWPTNIVRMRNDKTKKNLLISRSLILWRSGSLRIMWRRSPKTSSPSSSLGWSRDIIVMGRLE